MKSIVRAFPVILFFCIVISGCSIPRRGLLEDNVFFSTQSPNVQITVNRDFLYTKGKLGEWEHQFFDNENHKVIYIHHVLHNPNENNIDYFNDPEHWIYRSSDNTVDLERSAMNIYENKWYVQDFIEHSSTASCHMARKLSTFTSMHDLLHVLYAMEIPPYTCSSWLSTKSLSTSQNEFIEKFKKGFKEDIQIEKYIEN